MSTKLPVLGLAVLFCVTLTIQAPALKSDSYVGAVVEYAPIGGATPENKEQIFMKNVGNFMCFMQEAAKQKVDILVFPEAGLVSIGLPQNPDGTPALAFVVPDPGNNPCNVNSSDIAQGLRDLSCGAKKHSMYVVVNLPEKVICSSGLPADLDSTRCPPTGSYFYNTNVVFNRKGSIIARYRKFNLYNEPGFEPMQDAEHSTFDTDFGVRFGMFTGFDIMFKEPAVILAQNYSICDFAFPTVWFSEAPFLTAVQAQAAWSHALDVNLLSAGYNKPEVGSAGSGIFLGCCGTLKAVMPNVTTSRLLVGSIPKKQRCEGVAASQTRRTKDGEGAKDESGGEEGDEEQTHQVPLSAWDFIVRQRQEGAHGSEEVHSTPGEEEEEEENAEEDDWYGAKLPPHIRYLHTSNLAIRATRTDHNENINPPEDRLWFYKEEEEEMPPELVELEGPESDILDQQFEVPEIDETDQEFFRLEYQTEKREETKTDKVDSLPPESSSLEAIEENIKKQKSSSNGEPNATDEEIEATLKNLHWLIDEEDIALPPEPSINSREARSEEEVDDTDDVIPHDHGVHLLADSEADDSAHEVSEVDDTDDVIPHDHGLHLLTDTEVEDGVKSAREDESDQETEIKVKENDLDLLVDTEGDVTVLNSDTEQSQQEPRAETKLKENKKCRLKNAFQNDEDTEGDDTVHNSGAEQSQREHRGDTKLKENKKCRPKSASRNDEDTERDDNEHDSDAEQTQQESIVETKLKENKKCRPKSASRNDENTERDDTVHDSDAEQTQQERIVETKLKENKKCRPKSASRNDDGESEIKPWKCKLKEGQKPAVTETPADAAQIKEVEGAKSKDPCLCKKKERLEGECPEFVDGAIVDGREATSNVGIFLKRDNLDAYETLTLISDVGIENSTLRLCDGTFCCNFNVVLEVRETRPHYVYRLVVFNGARTFDGVATGGIKVCGVVPCSADDLQSCGLLTLADEAAATTMFRRIAISGNFSSNHFLVAPTTLQPGLLALPADKFRMSSQSVREGLSLVTMETVESVLQEGLTLLTFAIYERH